DGLSGGAVTITDGSSYTANAGITNILGTLNLGTSTGATLTLGSALELVNNTTLQGPGVVNISGDASTATGGQIGTDSGGWTLTNDSTIQGTGVIGSNNTTFQNLNLLNNGTIDANTGGQTLSIQGTGGTIVNSNAFEATGGGNLNLATASAINNGAGTISADGAGSTVTVNTALQGGILTTTNGGAIQTGSAGARLDGSSSGAITISDGSTYTAGSAGLTQGLGTINLGTSAGGTLALTGALQLVNDTVLADPGVMTLAGGAQVGTNGSAWTLTNMATIQGNGLLGSNSGALFSNGSLVNDGSLIANGGTLTVAVTGGATNNGTMQASAGASLAVRTTLSNFSGGTLSGGSYRVFGPTGNGGTIQLSSLGTGGGEIVHNAAAILLDGPDSSLVDGGGQDALANFTDNTASGSFTIRNGRNFNAPGAFANAGQVAIGTGSTFGVNAGASNYNQSSGTTQVDGALQAAVTQVNGGMLLGIGTVSGALVNNGTVKPGDLPGPGTLHVTGDYTQGAGGVLDIELAGTGAGQFDRLLVGGAASLSGSLDVNLLGHFSLASGDSFEILDFASLA